MLLLVNIVIEDLKFSLANPYCGWVGFEVLVFWCESVCPCEMFCLKTSTPRRCLCSKNNVYPIPFFLFDL